MSDKPILFNGQMVNALLDGRKTQTRRVIKSKDLLDLLRNLKGAAGLASTYTADLPIRANIGDRLWVRETVVREETDQGVGYEIYAADRAEVWPLTKWYRARNFVPSIHMPRWASRLTLIVTDVRVQRVQDISEADAGAEGADRTTAQAIFSPEELQAIAPYEILAPDAVNWIIFGAIWDNINAKRGFGWEANPWVAAYTFTVHKTNIDSLAAKP